MRNFFEQFDPPNVAPYSGNPTLDAEYPFDQFNLAPPPTAANFFDQFDPPSVTPSPGSVTLRAGNFFDQFDTPSAPSRGNVFDQFDTPSQLPKLTPKLADQLGIRQYRGHLDGTEVRRAELAKPPNLDIEKPGTQSDWADGGKLFMQNVADGAATMAQGMYSQASEFTQRASGAKTLTLDEVNERQKLELELRRATEDGPNGEDLFTAQIKGATPDEIRKMADGIVATQRQNIQAAQKKIRDFDANIKSRASDTAKAIAQGYDKIAGDLAAQRKLYKTYYDVDQEFQESFLGQLVGAVGQVVPQVGVGVLPGVGLAALQSQAFQASMDDAKETAERTGKPYDPEQAYAYAMSNSFQQMLLEKTGIEIAIGRLFKAGTKAGLHASARRVAARSTGGGSTEVIQGAAQDHLATTQDIEERNPFDPKRRLTEFGIGIFLDMPLSTSAEAADYLHRKATETKLSAAKPTPPAPKYNPEEKGRSHDLFQLPPSTEEAAPSSKASETPATPAPPPGRPVDTRAHVATQMQDLGITREQAVGELKAMSDTQKAWLHDLATGTVVQIDTVHFIKTDTGWRRLIDSGGEWEGTTPENAVGTNPGVGIGWNEGTSPKVVGSYQSTGAKLDGHELSPSVFLPVGQQPAASSPKTASQPREPGSAIPTKPAPPVQQKEPGELITEEEQRKTKAEGAPPDTKATETESSEVTSSHVSDQSSEQFAPPAQRASGRGMRQKIDFARQRQAGFLNPSIMQETVAYGRQIFRKGMDYLDWAVRMVRDLGDKIAPHLRDIFRAINGGPWNSQQAIRGSIEARSLKNPELSASADELNAVEVGGLTREAIPSKLFEFTKYPENELSIEDKVRIGQFTFALEKKLIEIGEKLPPEGLIITPVRGFPLRDRGKTGEQGRSFLEDFARLTGTRILFFDTNVDAPPIRRLPYGERAASIR